MSNGSKKLNEKDLVKNDIVNAPEVTAMVDGEPVAEAVAEPVAKAVETASNEPNPNADLDGKLFSALVEDLFGLFNVQLDEQRQTATKELGAEIFQRWGLSGWPRIAVLLGLISVPAVPPVIRFVTGFFAPKKPERKEDDPLQYHEAN